MQILILHGSLRAEKSNIHVMAEAFTSGAQAAGAIVTLIRVLGVVYK